MMEKLAIFGASGRTGKLLTELALQNGYQVNALVRTSTTFDLQHPDLQVIKGNVLDLPKVEETIHGADAVINVIGPVSGSPTALQSVATQNIMRVMRQNDVMRLIELANVSYGVLDERDKPGLRLRLTRELLKYTAKARVADSLKHDNLIQQSSRDWTIVRAFSLDEAPPHDNYRVGYVGPGMGNSTTRADVAAFILGELKRATYIRQMPLVSN
ncbi:MAG: NAD(P)H-binding protein [Ardenticatenaceae bacterium]|nr:NAD(P)H-binding protein [Ardenticatenaceae bacterium]